MPINYQQHRIGISNKAPLKYKNNSRFAHTDNIRHIKLDFKLIMLIILLQIYLNQYTYDPSHPNYKNYRVIKCNSKINNNIENNYDKIKQKGHKNNKPSKKFRFAYIFLIKKKTT